MRRHSDSQRGGRVSFTQDGGSAEGARRQQPDPAVVIKEFDNKMKAIQDLLSAYQQERTAQAKGQSAGGATSRAHQVDVDAEVAAAQKRRGPRPSTAGAGPNPAGGLVPGSDDFFKQLSSGHRRVRSAAPGATRKLNTKIDFYRSNMEMAQERADRALEAKVNAQAHEAAAAAAAAAAHHTPPSVNFVDTNRRGVVPYALPYNLQMTIETLRDQGLGLRSRTPGGGSGPSSARSRRPSGPPTSGAGSLRAWSAGGMRPQQGRAPPGSSSPGLGPQRPDSGVHPAWGAAGGGPAAARNLWNSNALGWPAGAAQAAAHAASEAHGHGHGHGHEAGALSPRGGASSFSFAGPSSPPSASAPLPAGGSHRRSSAGGGPGSLPAVFLTGVDLTASRPGTASSPPQAAPRGSPPNVPHLHLSPGAGASRPGTAASDVQHSPTGAWGAAAAPTRGPASTHGSSVSDYYAVTSITGDGISGSGVDSRRLRLVLTSRPAAGGSPTARVDFIAEHAALRVERAVHAVEVRERAAELAEQRAREVAAAVAARQDRLREAEARKAAAAAAAEVADKQQQWTAIVGLCSKLTFIADQITEDRRVRLLRELRKEAAVKIATWYKRVLLRRRQRELVDLIGRLRRLMRPYIWRQKLMVRQRAAQRLVHFMSFAESSNMAVVGAKKLKTSVELLQNNWRNALLIRNLQRSALLNSLARFEREVVSLNKRNERLLQTQLMRVGKAVNILQPDLGLGINPNRPVGQQLPGAPPALSVAPSMQRQPTLGRGLPLAEPSTFDRSRQPSRKSLLAAAEPLYEEEDEVLRNHREVVPKEIRERIAFAFLAAARKQHCRLLEAYQAQKALYLARKPIEEMRQKMLRDAGLHVEPEVSAPVLPRMGIMHPRATLRELLRQCVAANTERLRTEQEDAVARRDALLEEHGSRAVREQGSGAVGTGGPGGGVAWADQSRRGGAGPGGRQLGSAPSRRSPSRRRGGGAGAGGGAAGGGGAGAPLRSASPTVMLMSAAISGSSKQLVEQTGSARKGAE